MSLLMIVAMILAACGTGATPDATEDIAEATSESMEELEATEEITTSDSARLILATTTSTNDTGLLDAILPEFEEQSGYEVDVVAVGTGQALALGEAGDADVLLVHAREREDAF